MKRKIKSNNAITLVALVVTIVILLILSGISISALTNTEIFQKVKEAKEKSKNAQKQENEILDEYEKEMDQYGDNTLISNFKSGKIKVGDYIKYEPDTITDTDENYNTLISNLIKYSGSGYNKTETLKQESVDWRVLDVKDGHVRLISSKPTNYKIELYGFNGYNNAVKLLDDTCKILYINTKFTQNAQNLKFDDITQFMLKKPELDNTEYNPKKIYYPNIFILEENNIADALNNQTKLKESEQRDYIINASYAESKTLKNTNFTQYLTKDSFSNEKYYELFISQNLKDYDETYWLSSRCAFASAGGACFNLRRIKEGQVTYNDLYATNCNQAFSKLSYRPVITLNSSVQLDKVNSGDGSSPEKAYAIK